MRQSHRTRIYEDFLGRIHRGELRPDDRLVDTAIAADLGVSRMPVREALMQLVHEGYLEGTSRGFTLPSLDHSQILEVFELRRLLEPHAAASAAQSLDAAALARMQAAVSDAASTLDGGDIGLFFRACEVFRNTWLGAVPNRELRQTILRYIGQVQKVRMITMHGRATQKVIVQGQRDLLEAFDRRDALTASHRMLGFVFQSERSYLEIVAANSVERT